MTDVLDPDDECIDCAEGVNPFDVCPNAKRPCGHHCNCVWIHDCCHWCGMESVETDNGGEWPGDHGFEELGTPVRNVLNDAAKGVTEFVEHDPDSIDLAQRWLRENYSTENIKALRARIIIRHYLSQIGYQ